MATSAPNPAVPAPGSSWSTGRVILVVVGSVAALIGASLLIAGAVTLWAHLTQRDDDGFLTSPTEHVQSAGHAVTSEGIELADLRDGGDWLVDQGLGRVRISATGEAGPVFVGIAPEAAVDRYLANVSHDELREIVSGRPRYRDQPGGAPALAPERARIWAASAAGPGTQTVDWEARDGRWAIVVMNADGTRAVAADVSVGAKLGILPWIAAGLLLAGLVILAAGAGMIGVAVHGSAGAAATPAQEVATTTADGAYPVAVEAELDPGLSRWMWLVKWILAIPHYVILAFLWAAFFVLTVVALVVVAVTGRYPRAIFDFNAGVLRWSWRVAYYSYAALGTDRYPPFTLADADYPARLEVPYPERLSRGKALVKWWLLALPHYLVLGVLAGGFTAPFWVDGADGQAAGGPSVLALLVFFAAVALLFTGRYPRDLFRLVVGINRWVFRVIAYAALMRDEYPPFRLDP
jgi:hypothetical protein